MSDPNNPSPAHGLTEQNILTAFPVALQNDPRAAALAEITARLLVRRPDEIGQVCIYPRIMDLPEKLLDILAYDFKVDWWDPDYTLEEKRRTLADSWRVHKLLGTKYAVETALRAIYPKSAVEEWFEYGGKPYHFKIFIDLTDEQWREERPRNVLERVDFYKSLRSHLEAVTTSTTIDPAAIYLTPVLGSGMAITELPTLEPEFPASTIYIAPVLGSGSSSTTLPWLKEPDLSDMPPAMARASAAVHSITETALPAIADPPPGPLHILRRVTAIPSVPFLETTLPPLPEFASSIPAVAYGRATASIQTITTTKLPELEENIP